MREFVWLALVVAISGCTGLEMERVPTAEELRGWESLRPFIVRPTEVVGIYQNLDVDSVVFRYVSGVQDPEQFWAQVRRETQLQGWTEASPATVADGHSERCFQRLRTRGELHFSSAEEARVWHSATHVVVGWVQSDQTGTPKAVGAVHEGRFADEHIWPKFAAAQRGAPANNQLQRTRPAQATEPRR